MLADAMNDLRTDVPCDKDDFLLGKDNIQEIQIDMDQKSLVLYPIGIEDIFNSFLVQHMKMAREFVIRFEDPLVQLHCKHGLLELRYRTHKACENAKNALQKGINFLFDSQILVQNLSEFKSIENAMEMMWLKENGFQEPKANRLLFLKHLEVFDEEITDDFLLERIPTALSAQICKNDYGKRAYIEFPNSKEAKKTMRCLQDVLDCDINFISSQDKETLDSIEDVVTSTECTINHQTVELKGNKNKRKNNEELTFCESKRSKYIDKEDTETKLSVKNLTSNINSPEDETMKMKVQTNAALIDSDSCKISNETKDKVLSQKLDIVKPTITNERTISPDITTDPNNEISTNSATCNECNEVMSHHPVPECNNDEPVSSSSEINDNSLKSPNCNLHLSEIEEVSSTCVSPKHNNNNVGLNYSCTNCKDNLNCINDIENWQYKDIPVCIQNNNFTQSSNIEQGELIGKETIKQQEYCDIHKCSEIDNFENISISENSYKLPDVADKQIIVKKESNKDCDNKDCEGTGTVEYKCVKIEPDNLMKINVDPLNHEEVNDIIKMEECKSIPEQYECNAKITIAEHLIGHLDKVISLNEVEHKYGSKISKGEDENRSNSLIENINGSSSRSSVLKEGEQTSTMANMNVKQEQNSNLVVKGEIDVKYNANKQTTGENSNCDKSYEFENTSLCDDLNGTFTVCSDEKQYELGKSIESLNKQTKNNIVHSSEVPNKETMKEIKHDSPIEENVNTINNLVCLEQEEKSCNVDTVNKVCNSLPWEYNVNSYSPSLSFESDNCNTKESFDKQSNNSFSPCSSNKECFNINLDDSGASSVENDFQEAVKSAAELNLSQTSTYLSAVTEALNKAKQLMSCAGDHSQSVSATVETYMSLVLDGSPEIQDSNAEKVLKRVFQYTAEQNHNEEDKGKNLLALLDGTDLNIPSQQRYDCNCENPNSQNITSRNPINIADIQKPSISYQTSAFEEFVTKRTAKADSGATVLDDNVKNIDGKSNLNKSRTFTKTPSDKLQEKNTAVKDDFSKMIGVEQKDCKANAKTCLLPKQLCSDSTENKETHFKPSKKMGLLPKPKCLLPTPMVEKTKHYQSAQSASYESNMKTQNFYDYHDDNRFQNATYYSGIQTTMLNEVNESTRRVYTDNKESKSKSVRDKYLERYLDRKRKRELRLREKYGHRVTNFEGNKHSKRKKKAVSSEISSEYCKKENSKSKYKRIRCSSPERSRFNSSGSTHSQRRREKSVARSLLTIYNENDRRRKTDLHSRNFKEEKCHESLKYRNTEVDRTRGNSSPESGKKKIQDESNNCKREDPPSMYSVRRYKIENRHDKPYHIRYRNNRSKDRNEDACAKNTRQSPSNLHQKNHNKYDITDDVETGQSHVRTPKYSVRKENENHQVVRGKTQERKKKRRKIMEVKPPIMAEINEMRNHFKKERHNDIQRIPDERTKISECKDSQEQKKTCDNNIAKVNDRPVDELYGDKLPSTQNKFSRKQISLKLLPNNDAHVCTSNLNDSEKLQIDATIPVKHNTSQDLFYNTITNNDNTVTNKDVTGSQSPLKDEITSFDMSDFNLSTVDVPEVESKIIKSYKTVSVDNGHNTNGMPEVSDETLSHETESKQKSLYENSHKNEISDRSDIYRKSAESNIIIHSENVSQVKPTENEVNANIPVVCDRSATKCTSEEVVTNKNRKSYSLVAHKESIKSVNSCETISVVQLLQNNATDITTKSNESEDIMSESKQLQTCNKIEKVMNEHQECERKHCDDDRNITLDMEVKEDDSPECHFRMELQTSVCETDHSDQCQTNAQDNKDENNSKESSVTKTDIDNLLLSIFG